MNVRKVIDLLYVSISPAFAFFLIVWDDQIILDMVDSPLNKITASMMMVVFWVGFTGIYILINDIYDGIKGKKKKKEIEDV